MKPLAFEFFYDPLDMTACVASNTTIGELNRKAARDRLYFPLFLAEDMPIGELVLGYRFTPRSYRFGPLCDNVLGFNFVLPSGKMVKVGAQVVKNVTGFEFARFLTNSGYRFGTVERVILRLRSMAEGFQYRKVSGDPESLDAFRRIILGVPQNGRKDVQPTEGAHGEGPRRHSKESSNNPWGQVLDSLDFIAEEGRLTFYLSFSSSSGQTPLFDGALGKIASQAGCRIEPSDSLPCPSLVPYARIKTTLSKTLSQAKFLLDRAGGRAHGFLGNAFFHYDPAPEKIGNSETIETLQTLHQEVSAVGGHVRCDHLTYPRNGIQEQWEALLKKKWETLA